MLERARSSGAEVMLDQRVLFDGDCVSGIEVAGRKLGCRVLIAADGRCSSIVKQTGRMIARGPHLIGFKSHRPAYAGACDLTPPTIEMMSFVGGYVGLCELERGQLNICGLLPRHVLLQARGSIDQTLAELLPTQSFGAEGHWLTIADVRQQTATPHVSGVLYVGDAMGTIEPVAGQGMAIALQSAALVANMLLAQSQPRADAKFQRSFAWQKSFRSTIVRARRFGWLLRHPRLLRSLLKLSPPQPRLEELLLRACYRTTRLKSS